jgi:hypothetical protein
MQSCNTGDPKIEIRWSNQRGNNEFGRRGNKRKCGSRGMPVVNEGSAPSPPMRAGAKVGVEYAG